MTQKLNKSKKIGFWVGVGIFVLINLIIIAITLGIRMSKEKPDTYGAASLFLLKNVYLDNFFGQPALLLGFLTLIGYLILGRGARDSIVGSLKTIIGVLLLNIGSGVLVSMARPVFNAISQIAGSSAKSSAQIVPLDPYFGLSSSQNFLQNFVVGNNYVTWVSYVFMIAFAINIILILLKRWTNVHSLMVTGHIMYQQSAIIVVVVYALLFRDVPLLSNNGGVSVGTQVGVVLISSLLLGAYWGVGSTATIKATDKVTQNAGFAVGHQQMLAISLSYKIGKYFGKEEETAENRKLPKYLSIFEDNIFTQTVLISILFIILILVIVFAGPAAGVTVVKNNTFQSIPNANPVINIDFKQWNVFSQAHYGVNIVFGSLKIVAGLVALMTGVRMFVTELQQAFQGVSEKIIPNSVVAVDVAATYGFSVNSVTYGFLAGTIAQFIGVGLVIGLSQIPGLPIFIPIPLFITLFFNSGSLGVFANASGGYKAAIIVPAIVGFLEIIVIAFGTAALSNAFAATNTQGINPVSIGYNGMADWNLFYGLLYILGGYNVYAGYIFTISFIFGLLFFGQIVDSGRQSQKTFFQKLLKLNPELIQQNS